MKSKQFIIALTFCLLVCYGVAAKDTVENMVWPVVSVKSEGTNIATLQRLLNHNGYAIDVSGMFDTLTFGQVKQFQTDNQLTVDGIVGANSWKKLIPNKILKNGVFNDPIVGILQEHLLALGSAVSVDNDFGGGTESAVKAFQTEHGLVIDGQVGKNTWHTLLSEAAPEAQERYTHMEAMTLLSQAGIPLNRTCFNRYIKEGCTSLDQIRKDNIDNLIKFKNSTACKEGSFMVTGGTEIGHTKGTESHFNGYKIDIKLNDCILNYITTTYTYIGERGGNYKAKLYEDQRTNILASERDNGIYALENNHWDIKY